MRLADITKENWEAVILLTSNEDGSHTIGEKYVASNAYSIVQSIYEKGWVTKAIEAEDNLIGFAMYGLCEEENIYEICRLMLDRRYQGKGYGKQALALILEEMKKQFQCKEIYLSVALDNIMAKGLYEKAGFVTTGEVVDDEEVYKLNII
ncbi:GNAT family N-acetyltransferase [Anaerocolumna sp. AGMB13020]|uniref:GNAT family N-acetyltransferase n=1 Tax=Anaerocolumna sp. AGMB13020 TaxID=3081750 RepID=UPI00295358FB|nr:GNAT family N-acetyltransferase [Anaerocolumna sp. AGMB13020]WOO38763.1 GNAT family N-acetyltransferase [Anaerocolumna sp. AGMB13020]